MGQSTPEQFAIPGTAVRPPWKAKAKLLEAPDHGVGTAFSLEQFEDCSNGALNFLVRVERNLIVVENKANWQSEVQLTFLRLVELTSVEARADDVQLCLGEGALHAEHKAAEARPDVTAVLVDHERAGDGAQLEQAMPILVGARQPRGFQGEDRTDLAHGYVAACRTADVLALKSHNLDATIFWFRAPNFGDPTPAASPILRVIVAHRRDARAGLADVGERGRGASLTSSFAEARAIA